MKKNLTIVSRQLENVILRAITKSDQENLRQWKNANRFAFFHQEIITPEQQAKWFKGYLERINDWMFIVIVEGQAIGCMGFRILESEADVYNVILGHPEMSKRGLILNAMRLMCSYIATKFTREINVKVLRTNTALEWYKKVGFREAAAHDTYLSLKLDLAQFQPCEFEARP